MRGKAEAVARGGRRGDAPARGRNICSRHIGRTQQKKRNAGIAGGKMQPLAGEKIERRACRADDGAGHARAQRFFRRPQGVLAASRFAQHDPDGIETETVQTMAVQGPGGGALLALRDENHRTAGRQAAEQGGDETTGGRRIGRNPGQDFVHGGEGQAALRKKDIQRRQAEGKNPAGRGNPLLPGHQPAQFMHDFGPFSTVLGKG